MLSFEAYVLGLRGPAADTTALDAAAAVLTLAKRLPALTTAGATYHAVYSTQRLLDGVGPLVDAADGAGGPVTALAGSEEGVSLSAVRSVRGASDAARVVRVYDQSGNGRHLYQDDATKQPGLHEDVTTNGVAALIMDGRRAGIGDATQRGLKFDSWALDGQANTRFMVLDPTDSAAAQLYERFTAANPAGARNLYTRSDDGAPYAPDHGAKLQYAGSIFSNLPSSPCVIVIRDRPDGTDIFYNTVKVSKALAPPAGALQSGIIGYGEDAGLTSFNVAARYLAYGAINKAVSDAEVAAIVATLTARFNLAPEYAPRVIMVGDSIGEGVRTTLTRSRPFFARPRLKRPIRFYDFALSGRYLAQAFAQRAEIEGNGELYQPDRTCIAILQGGINDIHAGGSTGKDLYLNVTTPYVTYLKNMGWKVIVCTLLPQTANNVAFAEPARQEYNTYVRNNTAGADAICDLAADPVMGVYPDAPNNAALYFDKIHPTALGYAYEAPTLSAAINALL